MKAEVERGKGGPDAEDRAKSWLDRISGPADKPAWVCSKCGASRESWVGRCDPCGAFASYDWQESGEPRPAPAALPSERPKLLLLPEALQASAEAPLRTSEE